MKFIIRLTSFTFVFFTVSCTSNSPKQVSTEDFKMDTSIIVKVDPKLNEDELKLFLYSIEGTYGWATKSNNITFGFFTDGRLHIQGPDGEATMWQGSWKLKQDQLTLDRVDLNRLVTYKMAILSDTLLLDTTVYTRIRL